MTQQHNLPRKAGENSTASGPATAGPGSAPASGQTPTAAGLVNPGDEAPAGTPGTGENICRDCGGSGSVNGAPCACCGGSGKVITAVGGA